MGDWNVSNQSTKTHSLRLNFVIEIRLITYPDRPVLVSVFLGVLLIFLF